MHPVVAAPLGLRIARGALRALAPLLLVWGAWALLLATVVAVADLTLATLEARIERAEHERDAARREVRALKAELASQRASYELWLGDAHAALIEAGLRARPGETTAVRGPGPRYPRPSSTPAATPDGR